VDKRENVIKGIKHCIGDDCNGDKWSECEYSGHGCIDALLEDAIALLKAREPRVMTIEEVTEDCPDVVWFDDRHFVRVFAALPKNENYHGWVKFTCRNGYERHDHIDGYGKEWRCWTSRPTDAQREKEPWNG